MTKHLSIFNNLRPHTVGFDDWFDHFDAMMDDSFFRGTGNFPPYNIVKTGENTYDVELALAGFTKDEFNIHVVPEGKKLVVQGVQDRGEDKKEYYHKGIASRNFTRTFALMEDVEVTGADFVDGMLNISLIRIIPEEKKPKEIKVK